MGFPGNSHDSIILRSTRLWKDITENNIIPSISKSIGGEEVGPMIVADSAFPCTTWIMKPYTSASLSPEEKNFNYSLSRARMVTEGAYGKLKGRFRVLYQKCECNKETVKAMVLACIVLHNTCIQCNEPFPPQLDLTVDPATNERRDRDTVRKLLDMHECATVKDSNIKAGKIRN